MPELSFLDRGLKAADWFVNTQTIMSKPNWDVDHGRLVYTYHIPTRRRVQGISWTQGRGIYVLLSAYEATSRPEYLRSALHAGEYIKCLQILDARDPRFFGAIREECPFSWYCYPRDAQEAGLGLLALYRITGDDEWLYRARLFGDWFISQAMPLAGGDWAPGGYQLSDYDRELFRKSGKRMNLPFHMVGGSTFFVNLAKASGDSKYIEKAFRPMIARLVREYFDEERGVVLSQAKGAPPRPGDHHASADERYRGVALNDDAVGVAMLVAYKELGDEKLLEFSTKYGEWMLKDRYPLPCHAGVPLRALTLAELSRHTGEKKYAEFAAAALAPIFVEKQVIGCADPATEGAFRGEDERPECYGPPGSTGLDFICTRMTAYSAIACFKLDGTIFGPYYSAENWETRRVEKPGPELLAPLRP